MIRKVISIIFYAISGFFFYGVCLVAFMSGPPGLIKFAVIGVFCIPAFIALGIGLACSRFQNWKRDVGIVITFAAGCMSFLVFTMACLLMSREFRELLPGHKMSLFSNFVPGISFVALFGITGILLIKTSKRKAEPAPPGQWESR